VVQVVNIWLRARLFVNSN